MHNFVNILLLWWEIIVGEIQGLLLQQISINALFFNLHGCGILRKNVLMDGKTSILQPFLCIFSAFGRKYIYQDMSRELLFSLLHNRKHILRFFIKSICITITSWQADITYLFTLWSRVSCKNSLWNVGYYLGHFRNGLPNWSSALGKPRMYSKLILKTHLYLYLI